MDKIEKSPIWLKKSIERRRIQRVNQTIATSHTVTDTNVRKSIANTRISILLFVSLFASFNIYYRLANTARSERFPHFHFYFYFSQMSSLRLDKWVSHNIPISRYTNQFHDLKNVHAECNDEHCGSKNKLLTNKLESLNACFLFVLFFSLSNRPFDGK